MLKTFIYNMLSETGAISSKRVIAILGALVLFSIIIYSVATGKNIDYHIYDGLVLVVLGAAGITAFEKVKMASATPVTETPTLPNNLAQ